MGKLIKAVWFMLATFLALLSGNHGEVVHNFNLLDPWGEETSFPYVGGVVRILCNVSADDNTTKTYLVNKTDSANPDGRMENNTFVLEPGLVGTKYNCHLNAHPDLVIGPLHCNPFSTIPIADTCSPYHDRCLIEKDGHAKCDNNRLDKCFKFEPKSTFSSEYAAPHPHLNNVCFEENDGSSASKEEVLCSTRSQLTERVFGLTNDAKQCSTLHSYGVKLNDKKVIQNSVNFASITTKKWNITVVKKTETEFKCALSDEHNQNLKSFTFSTNKSVTPAIQPRSLPAKLKLRCSENNQQTTLSFSVFVLVFDSNLTIYNAVIKKTPMNDGIVLTCSCKVPKGFICGSTWDYPSISSEQMIVQNRRKKYNKKELEKLYLPIKPTSLTLKPWEHPTPVNYTCSMQVFAYDYPNTYDLLLVPLEREVIETTITITSEDFATTSPKNDKGAELNEGKSKNQTNSQSESKVTALMALTSICLITVVVLVIAVIFGYIRVGTISKKQVETEAKLNLSKAAARESNRRKTSSFSTDQDNNKRASLVEDKKKSIPPKLPSRKIDNVESKYGGLKARRN